MPVRSHDCTNDLLERKNKSRRVRRRDSGRECFKTQKVKVATMKRMLDPFGAKDDVGQVFRYLLGHGQIFCLLWLAQW